MQSSQGRLLIVDDEPSLLASYARSLTRAGFEVVEAADGAGALRRVERQQFDAVLVDLSVPAMDGLTLLRRLRLRAPELPVILMLNAPDNRARLPDMEDGA